MQISEASVKNSMGNSLKKKNTKKSKTRNTRIRLAIRFSNLTAEYTVKRYEYIASKGHLYHHVYSSPVNNRQNLKSTNVLIH